MPKDPKRTGDFLGTGWKYPLYTGDKSMTSQRERSIEESIMIILSTAKGERVMRPDFGCDIHRMPFSLNNKSTRIRIANHVRQALFRWEPRIVIIDVKAYSDEREGNRINVNIDYKVLATNIKRNLVYPFFL